MNNPNHTIEQMTNSELLESISNITKGLLQNQNQEILMKNDPLSPEKADFSDFRDSKCSFHIKSLLITAITISLTYFFFYYSGLEDHEDRTRYLIQKILFGGFAILSYCVYLIECCYYSSTKKFIGTKQEIQNLDSYIEKLKNTVPKIKFKIECYHYESQTRYDTYTDSNGNTKSIAKTSSVRVTSYKSEHLFNYSHQEDQTGIIQLSDKRALIKLSLVKELKLADKYTEEQYNEQRRRFVNANNHMDKNYHEWVEIEIEGYEDKILVNRGNQSPGACISKFWYSLCSICLMSWLYRILFDQQIVGKSITIKKWVKLNQ